MSVPGPLRLDRTRRVRSSQTFGTIIRRGVRVADKLLQVWALPTEGSQTRLGIIVSRRHGNAIVRNRLKRVLREAFRHQHSELPGDLDLVCRPQLGRELQVPDVRRALQKLSERAQDLLVRREDER